MVEHVRTVDAQRTGECDKEALLEQLKEVEDKMKGLDASLLMADAEEEKEKRAADEKVKVFALWSFYVLFECEIYSCNELIFERVTVCTRATLYSSACVPYPVSPLRRGRQTVVLPLAEICADTTCSRIVLHVRDEYLPKITKKEKLAK